MSERREHWLKPNHKSETMSRCIVVDNETWTRHDKQTLRLGCATYMRFVNKKWYEEEFDYSTTQELHEWLDKIVGMTKKGRIWMIAHGMDYDFNWMDLLYFFQHGEWKTTGSIVPKNPCIYNYRKDDVSIRVISSTNWYHNSLEDLGKKFGCPKLPSPDFKTSDWMVSDEEMRVYCRGDVNLLMKVVKDHVRFIQDNDLGALQATSPGQSMASYKHRFMPEKLYVHYRPGLIELELDSYRGGRTEMFQQGKVDDAYYVDFNSMYPSVMKGNLYPVRPLLNKPAMLFSDRLPKDWEDDLVVARCELKLKDRSIGVRREDGRLIWPIGHAKATLCSPEFEYLEQHPEKGKVVKFIKAMPYEGKVIFDEYIDFFHGLRLKAILEKDLVTEAACKLWLNSLYGKMGQRLHPPIVEAGLDEKDNGVLFAMKDTGCMEFETDDFTYIRIGDTVHKRGRRGLNEIANESMPRISSFCTAYARMKLQELIDLVGEEDCYYCDTDSLFTDEDGRDAVKHLIHQTELGKLKVEGPGDCHFVGLKHYKWKGKWKRKGIRMKDAVQLDEDTWEVSQTQTGLSSFRVGESDCVRVTRIRKHLSNDYDKGTVNPITKRVAPLVLKQW